MKREFSIYVISFYGGEELKESGFATREDAEARAEELFPCSDIYSTYEIR